MSDDLLLAYIAGFFDGEGCISIVRRMKRDSYALTIQVGQMERAPLEMFKARFGGTIYVQKRSRHSFSSNELLAWRLSKRDQQRSFLEVMIPFLRSKKQEAQLGLRFLDVMLEIGFGGHGKRARPELVAERAAIFSACKAAKSAKLWHANSGGSVQ